jgi:hypothetical protein
MRLDDDVAHARIVGQAVSDWRRLPAGLACLIEDLAHRAEVWHTSFDGDLDGLVEGSSPVTIQ